jgi:cytochrome c oxidase cbb3-type subunit 3
MAEFTSSFWPWYIAIATVLSLAACTIFLWWVGRGPRPTEGETSGHVWDEDLEELNNPLPGWWRWMFYLSVAFSAVYLVLYPGLAIFPGTKGWTQEKQWQQEVERHDAEFRPVYGRFETMEIPQLAADADARRIGERLYLNRCTACHGSDAGGAIGYPNLRDDDWQWGGSPEAIETTITYGRFGVMAAWEPTLGAQGVEEVTQYVMSFSGRATKPELAAAGKAHFERVCISCHMADGKGNPALGSLDLTDDLWRYGGSEQAIRTTIAKGRKGMMPAHDGILDPVKIKLLAAYVYSLSQPGSGQG